MCRSGRRIDASTICTVLNRCVLPKRLEVVDAIVEGCGSTDEDRQKFAMAWRELVMRRMEAYSRNPVEVQPDNG
jgi:hypothetical protein